MCFELEQSAVVQHLIKEDLILPVFAIGVGSIIAVVAIVSGAVTRVVVSRGRERTRRELAAYIAEGTLDPDKAVALMNANQGAGTDRRRGGCCG
jgi:hypothetical protein